MLEAEEEDSVLAVAWLLAFTYGSGGLPLAFLAGTIGNLGFACCDIAIFMLFCVANLAVLVPYALTVSNFNVKNLPSSSLGL